MTRHSIIPFWLENDDDFVAATWFWPSPAIPHRPLAVLIVPGIAMEDRTISVGLVPLAERLTALGIPTMMVALKGTGQSAGDLSTADVSNSWATDVQRALKHMRDAGFEKVVVVAVRLSALVVLESVALDGLEGLVLWAPVFSGRRYARELSMLAATGLSGRHGNGTDLAVMIGTFPLPPRLLERFKTMKVSTPSVVPRRTLIVDDPDRFETSYVDTLRATGAVVDTRLGPETAQWLYITSDSASVPQGDIDYVVHWISGFAGVPAERPLAVPVVSDRHLFERDGVSITEQFIHFSDANLIGIYAGPTEAPEIEDSAWIIATSVQLGKVFVDFARDEAVSGRPSLRFDLSSNGLSERRTKQGWGELNGRYGPVDVELAIQWMRPSHPRLCLLGFCSGGIAVLNVKPRKELEAIVAINPPVFIPRHSWRTSDGTSGSALWKAVNRIDRRRIGERLRWKFRRDWYRWSPSLRMLRRHRRSGTRVLMQFDEVDPGWIYLRRISTALRDHGNDQTINVKIYSNIGHLLDRADGRQEVLADGRAFGLKHR